MILIVRQEGCIVPAAGGLAVFEQGVKARSGQGSPANTQAWESDEADSSAGATRRGAPSVPARK